MDPDSIEIEMLHYPNYRQLAEEAIGNLPIEINCNGGKKIRAKYISSYTPTILFDAEGETGITIGKDIMFHRPLVKDGKREIRMEYRNNFSAYNITLRITQ